MLPRLATFLQDRRRAVLIGLTVLSVAAAFVAVRIRFDFTPQAIYRGADDSYRFSEEFKETFGHDETALLLVFDASDFEGGVFDEDLLAWQRQIAADLMQIPLIERVLTLGHFGPNPLVEGVLFSVDRRVGAVLADLHPDAREIDATQRILAEVHRALAAHPPPDGLRVHLSGLPAIRADIVNNLAEDQALLMPLAALLFVVALAVIFRRVCGVVIPLLVVGVGLCWLIALMVLTGQSINIISNILPILLLVIGIANSVHIVSRYAEERARSRDRREATRKTIITMGLACLLTFGTTAIGFLSLTGAHSSLLRGVGWQTATGMVLLYIAAMLCFGTLLPMFRAPGLPKRVKPPGEGRLARITERPRTVLVASLLLIGAAVWFARDIEVNARMFETYDDDHPSLVGVRLLEEKLGGLIALDVSLQGNVMAAQARAKEFAAFAERQDGVLGINSFAVLATRRFLTPDGQRGRIRVAVRDLGTRDTLALIDTLEADAKTRFPELDVRMTGTGYMYARSLDRFVRDLLLSFAAAAVVIFGMIALALRSLKLALLSVLPNMAPLLLTAGYIGLRGYDLNVGNAIVFAISLGVAVDDTIHFFVRFKEEIAKDGDVRAAVRRTMDGAGRAIVLTSLLVISGLGVLMFSDFVPTRRFAELTCVTMLGALVGDLLLLPSSLLLFRRR